MPMPEKATTTIYTMSYLRYIVEFVLCVRRLWTIQCGAQRKASDEVYLVRRRQGCPSWLTSHCSVGWLVGLFICLIRQTLSQFTGVHHFQGLLLWGVLFMRPFLLVEGLTVATTISNTAAIITSINETKVNNTTEINTMMACVHSRRRGGIDTSHNCRSM